MKAFGMSIIFLFMLHCSLGQIINHDYHLQRKIRHESVAFQLNNNAILLPLQIGFGLEVYFILDSGSTSPIITDPLIANIIDLEYVRDLQLKGYGEEKPIDAFVAKGFSYQIKEKYPSDSQLVIVLQDALDIDQFFEAPVYGILGQTFFDYHQVHFDFSQKKMLLRQLGNKITSRRHQKLNVEIKQGKPFARIPILHNNQLDTLTMLIDTGFSGAINLYPHKQYLLTDNENSIKNYIGVGINGRVTSTLFLLDWIRIANTCIPNIPASIIDSTSLVNTTIHTISDGSIGMDVLKRFHLIVDYKEQAMYLKPKPKVQSPFYYNASGLRLISYEDTIKVMHVREQSAAEKAGVWKEDILLAVDGKSIKNLSIESIYERLNHFSSPMRALLLRRNGKEVTVVFRIDDYLLVK